MKDILISRIKKLTHICIIDNVLYDCPFANSVDEIDMEDFSSKYKDLNCVIIQDGVVEKEILGSAGNAKLLEKTIREYKEESKCASTKVTCTCSHCGKKAEELEEYIELAKIENYEDANEAVIKSEGTYNSESNTFYCTPCYVEIGMPKGIAKNV